MQEEESQNLEQFNTLAKRIFTEVKGKVYIGGEEIKPDVLEVLQDQARNLQTSQLYEILKATIINESADLALKQSQKWEDVNFAKALYHIMYVLDNILLNLRKK